MTFDPPLIPGRLLRRYQRFLADVALGDGTVVTVHCPNTGAMLGCQAPGSVVWLSTSDRPQRRCRHTWEIVEAAPHVLVGINTGRSNSLVHEALACGLIGELAGYSDLRREVTLPDSRSRVDFVLAHCERPPLYLEVKNVTAAVEDGVALFPDAVSERATRHVRELAALVRKGCRAVLLFCVQREDVHTVRPADAIDPTYAAALRAAASDGLEVLAYRAQVSPSQIRLHMPITCRL